MTSFVLTDEIITQCLQDTASFIQRGLLEKYALPIFKDRVALRDLDPSVTCDQFLEYIHEHQGDIRDEYYTRIQLLFTEEDDVGNSLRAELAEEFLQDYEQNLRYRGLGGDAILVRGSPLVESFLQTWGKDILDTFYKFLTESFESDMTIFLTGGLLPCATEEEEAMEPDFDLLEERIMFWIDPRLSESDDDDDMCSEADEEY